MRVQDLLDPKIFRQKLDVVLKEKNQILAKVYNRLPLSADDIAPRYLDEYAPRLAPMIADTVGLVHEALERGPARAARGGPGHLPRPRPRHLSLRHLLQPGGRRGLRRRRASAPATSTGSSASPRRTSPGSGRGPFPTELADELGDDLVERGHEYGTNTGRRRRTGWFDAVMIRQAVRLNSLSEMALTKLDVLDTFETLKVCVAYELDGDALPATCPTTSRCCTRPRRSTRSCPGWQTDLSGRHRARQLPAAARDYVAVPGRAGRACPIRLVGVGPGREQFVRFAA